MEVHQSSLFETQMAKAFARLLDHAKMNSNVKLDVKILCEWPNTLALSFVYYI